MILLFSILAGVILLLYTIVCISSGKKVVISKLLEFNSLEIIKADQIYYLPTASLVLEATAQVSITKAVGTNTIIKKELIGMTFKISAKIEPDTQKMVTLNYSPNIFANDEVLFTTDSSGLLQNISSDTEDRIAAIIQQFCAAPKAFEEYEHLIMEKEPPEQKGYTRTIECVNTFNVSPTELQTGSFSKEWIIPVDGYSEDGQSSVDASFSCVIDSMVTEAKFEKARKGVAGVLTRPLRRYKIAIEQGKKSDKVINELLDETAIQLDNETADHSKSYDLLIPDHSCLVHVPIKRHPFIRSQYIPKFSSGLLVENNIHKPSEFEGFLSIPINVLKAIASIPSALFHFKVSNPDKAGIAGKSNSSQATKSAISPKPTDTTVSKRSITDDSDSPNETLANDQKEDSNTPQSLTDYLSLSVDEVIELAIKQNQDTFSKSNILYAVHGKYIKNGQALDCISVHLSDNAYSNYPSQVKVKVGAGPVVNIDVDYIADVTPPKAHFTNSDRVANSQTANFQGSVCCRLFNSVKNEYYFLTCSHVMTGGSDQNYGGTLQSPGVATPIGDWCWAMRTNDIDVALVRIAADTPFQDFTPGIKKQPRVLTTSDMLSTNITVIAWDFDNLVQKPISGKITSVKCPLPISIDYNEGKFPISNLIILSQVDASTTPTGYTTLTQPGDSGSMVYDQYNNPIGMIVAGNNKFSYAIPLGFILSQTNTQIA